MASLKELYDLVHVLTKNEKKHISLMMESLGGKGKSRYVNSFKTINSAKTFQPEKLKEHLNGGFSGMSLTEANTYIYDFICKALISYKDAKNLGYSNQLLFIELLINRKLFASAHKKLLKLIPELEEKAPYALLLRAEELHEIITINYAPVNSNYEFRKAFFKQRHTSINYAAQNLQFAELNFKFFRLVRTIGTPRNNKAADAYLKLWNDPLLHISTDQIHHRTIKLFYVLRGALMFTLNIPGGEVYIRNELSNYRERFKGKNLETGEMSLLDLLLSILPYQKQIDWQEIKQIEKRQIELEKKIQVRSIHEMMRTKINILSLIYFVKEKQYDKGILHYKKCMLPTEYERWKGSLLFYMVIFMGARLHYLNKEYSLALENILLIKEYEKLMRPYFLINYLFLTLLCHYKLGNHQLVDSLNISLTRNLRKLDQLYPPERAFLKFLKQANNINRFELNARKLSETLKIYSNDSYHHTFFEFGDMDEWLKLDE